jgi:hypothetical protein
MIEAAEQVLIEAVNVVPVKTPTPTSACSRLTRGT